MKVQLAGGKEVLFKQNKAGTLIPVKNARDSRIAPIVPLGDLVQTLGCDVSWTKREGLKITHPTLSQMSTHMSGKCP